ncbi:MAG TPA: cation acetate symporter [Pirellulaceae bacterium]|nr:cation acetate symporter [Pirellulaceae bacterium]
MSFDVNFQAGLVFAVIVAFTVGLSFYLGRQAKSASGFFAAGGGIPWFVNGVAFAGDYLSAASFLGICGMIAFYGYDGFLYSIGYLAGWVVALFVIAEPLKRLGRYTFADALDSKFQSRGIKFAAAISTLAVSLFYLIPQMVGAGALMRPLFGQPHFVGVITVGVIVIFIVVTAGMVSTTYVQFFKGGLLVIFSALLVVLILLRGLSSSDPSNDSPLVGPIAEGDMSVPPGYRRLAEDPAWEAAKQDYERFLELMTSRVLTTIRVPNWRESYAGQTQPSQYRLLCQTVTTTPQGEKIYAGAVPPDADASAGLLPVGRAFSVPSEAESAQGPIGYLGAVADSTFELWRKEPLPILEGNGDSTVVYYPQPTSGEQVLTPGNYFSGMRSANPWDRLNFVSLMLALFCGTASLPHILIRYYTVKDESAARKSTIVGIGSIGLFYVLTLYMGLGAMTSGAIDVTDSNMAAPLLAKSFSPWLFAAISAIAFTTVLGTVSGLIIAASGAVVHDLIGSVAKVQMSDHGKVRVARLASVVVGAVAIVLGILFQKMNVTYLVGWAFSVAASANLPALIMLLFWKRTTKQGIAAAVLVGMISSLAWILLAGDTYKDVYGWKPEDSIIPFSQPGIVTIPLGFLTLIVVSLLTPKPQPLPPEGKPVLR